MNKPQNPTSLMHGLKIQISNDALVKQYLERHFSECFSIIRFLSLFYEQSDLKSVINNHIDNLWQN